MSAVTSRSTRAGRIDRTAVAVLVLASVLVSVVAAIDLLLMLNGG
jgi:hypothetical protein